MDGDINFLLSTGAGVGFSLSAKMIDIRGIDRDKLLYQLWLNQKPAAFFTVIAPPPYDADAAKRAVDRHGYIDYVCGRCIKTKIFGVDEVDPSLYDRDAGAGTFQRVVDKLRAEQ
jgi:hypothetical protein